MCETPEYKLYEACQHINNDINENIVQDIQDKAKSCIIEIGKLRNMISSATKVLEDQIVEYNLLYMENKKLRTKIKEFESIKKTDTVNTSLTLERVIAVHQTMIILSKGMYQQQVNDLSLLIDEWKRYKSKLPNSNISAPHFSK